MDSSTRQLLLQLADEADNFIFLSDLDWWMNATKKEISGEGLRRFAAMLRERAAEGMERKYTNDPCPECHKHGTATGFVVNRDCKVCSGTGYKPANAS